MAWRLDFCGIGTRRDGLAGVRERNTLAKQEHQGGDPDSNTF